MNQVEEWWLKIDKYQPELHRILTLFCQDRITEFDGLCRERDRSAWKVLQQAWANAPDAPWVHDIPGWQALCELCAEGDEWFEERPFKNQISHGHEYSQLYLLIAIDKDGNEGVCSSAVGPFITADYEKVKNWIRPAAQDLANDRPELKVLIRKFESVMDIESFEKQ